ncbi:hypothetical protein BDW68DRAFT_172022 [Aspergillus falconensis]
MPESASFPFMKLHPEIRRIIWNLCLPSRTFELEAPVHKIKTRCKLLWTSTANWKPPVLARVCHESRAIAFEHVDLEEYQDEEYPRWLSRTFDIAFQCWEPRDTEDVWGPHISMTGELEYYSERCQGAGIIADRVLEFYPKGQRTEGVNPDLDSLKREMTEFAASVDTVVIHTTSTLAAESGLFGLLCDAPVQLIDATDTATILKYRDLWTAASPRDDEPARFFDNLPSFQSRLREWCSMLETRWVYHDWATRRKQDSEARHDLRPEDVWRGAGNTPPHRPLFRTQPRVLFSGEHFKDSDEEVQQLFPNKEHPFVRESIASMPRFRPVVMFRYCKKECHVSRGGEAAR